MAKRQSKRDSSSKRVPKVRIARPANRPFQLRYTDPVTKKEVRVSCGTRDEFEIARQKTELEAKLLLGLQPTTKRQLSRGPAMPWEDFREAYSTLYLVTLRPGSASDTESRLDVAERILQPRTLAEVANSDSLHRLQAALLEGRESRFNRPRSPHTVKSHIASVLAALNWAAEMEWLDTVPRLRKVKVSKLRHMKGRAIVAEEFERMLHITPKITGEEAAESWRYVLRGLWESGLRIEELMNLSWDDHRYIVAVWKRGAHPVLAIPANMQKNDTEEAIPLVPGFEAVLLEIPPENRHGWVFNPYSLQSRLGRRPKQRRPQAEWVGKIITRIGEAAGVIVKPASGKVPAKFASSHDLRRSFAERMYDAGLPEREITRIMRHSDPKTTQRYYAEGNFQKSAGVVRVYLGTREAAN